MEHNRSEFFYERSILISADEFAKFLHYQQLLKGSSAPITVIVNSGKLFTCLISSSDKWVVDSGATDYMTDHFVFQDLVTKRITDRGHEYEGLYVLDAEVSIILVCSSSLSPFEVVLGSLEDTVPTDRIVVLQGGWRLFGQGSAGEILLRLTYKAYVEDEEDDRMAKKFLDTDVSDDEFSDSDEIGVGTKEQQAIDSSSATDKESFMDVLAALIVSEEFQGIVASETGGTRSPDNSKQMVSTSRINGTKVESDPQTSDIDAYTSGGSALFWLAVVTSIAVLIAINMGGSSIFNP